MSGIDFGVGFETCIGFLAISYINSNILFPLIKKATMQQQSKK